MEGCNGGLYWKAVMEGCGGPVGAGQLQPLALRSVAKLDRISEK